MAFVPSKSFCIRHIENFPFDFVNFPTVEWLLPFNVTYQYPEFKAYIQ